MGSGPLDYGDEVGAARLLKQLSDYTSMLVREEVRRAQLEGNIPPLRPGAPGGPFGLGGLVALLGVGSLMVVGAAGVVRALMRERSR